MSPVARDHAVLHGVEQLAREIHLGAVRQVSAVIEAHAEYGVAGREQREVHGGIGLRAGVRLHVGVVGAEQLLRAIDRQLLGDVHKLAAAVVAAAGVALGVFVRQHRTLQRQHARAGVVLRGDQLDVILLPPAFALDGGVQLRVKLGDIQSGGVHTLRACM